MDEGAEIHKWREEKAKGDIGEEMFEAYLSSLPNVVWTKAELEEDLEGVDYILIYASGKRRRVQVKTDFLAGKTGNIFIETIGNEGEGRVGNVYKLRSVDLVVHILPDKRIGYCVVAEEEFNAFWKHWKLFRRHLQMNVSRATGESWVSAGICVPIEELVEYAHACVIPLDEL